MNTDDKTSNPEKSDSTQPTQAHAIAGSPKRVLLVDADPVSQERRAAILRKSGVEVTCADDIEHARVLWQPDSFHLVMIDTTNATEKAVAFQKFIKEESPKQLVKFFVGRPGLLSDHPLRESVMETERKINAMEKARGPVANASNRRSRETGGRTKNEISFGEAVRRAGGE
jgi:DNA-binding NtrC family response regulator